MPLLLALLAATLHVRVVDPTGAVVAGARVTARAEDGAERFGRTGRTGEAELVLAPGPHLVVVEAAGFEPAALAGVAVHPPVTRLDVPLTLRRREESLDVAERTDRDRGRSAANVLTEADIAALPDDPEEMEEALRHMAGPGAVLRVNGFGGGRLPPKAQIRQIRISMSAYAAEYHEGGVPRVDVFTKPGLGSWRRATTLALRDADLNARDPLSGQPGPGSLQRFSLGLDGPLQRDRTSLSLSAEGRRTEDARAIVATLPAGAANAMTVQTLDRLDVTGGLEHAWGTQTLRAEYQRNRRGEDGLGAGGLDLFERGYAQDRTEQLLRATATGLLAGRVAHQARLQLRWDALAFTPRSGAPAEQVAGAFTSGGAGRQGAQRTFEVELAEDLDWSRGRHALRAGVLFEAADRESGVVRNGNGTFLFPDLAAYEAGVPILFTRRDLAAPVAVREWRLGLYVQDDLRLGEHLSLNAGLRHEGQSLLADRWNLAPRGGLAWTPAANLTVRAGGGLFFDWLGSEVYEQAVRLDGAHEREHILEDPGYPEPLAAGGGVPPSSRVWLDPALRLSEVWRAEASVDRGLGDRTRLWATYALERGRNVYRARNRNVLVPGLGRPDPTLGNVTWVESSARAQRHALRVNAHYGTPGTRVSAMAFYLWSKATDEGDTPLSLPADAADLAAERGPAREDRRHRVFAMASLRPGHGLRLTTMLRAESGMPYDITTGRDDNGDTVANDRPPGVTRNQGRGWALVDLGARVSWTAAFGDRSGPAGVAAPRLVRFDPARDDAPPELGMPGDEDKRFRLTAYLHGFNLLNRVNASAYNGVAGSPTFGLATAAAPGRRFEAGLTFGF
jgi:hypothetical protein